MNMRKLKPKEIDDLRKQLGGDVVIHDSPSLDAAFGTEGNMADARVPSFDSMKGEATGGQVPLNALRSDRSTGKSGKKKKPTSSRESNPERDYSVRFSSKNVDRGSKVAIVSGKSKKVVYEQG
jgi:hypothetical protein